MQFLLGFALLCSSQPAPVSDPPPKVTFTDGAGNVWQLVRPAAVALPTAPVPLPTFGVAAAATGGCASAQATSGCGSAQATASSGCGSSSTRRGLFGRRNR